MAGAMEFLATPLGWGAAAIFAGFALVAVAKVYGLIFMRWKTPFRVGETMTGTRAEVSEWAEGEGYVTAGGELWRATSADQLKPGDSVSVISVNGLELAVRKKSA
ncbi:MAG: NfeD family protein [Pseudomonadota bacterium]